MAISQKSTHILLFGANGQLGFELRRQLDRVGTLDALGRIDADFTDLQGLRMVVRRTKPDIIINAAAYTSVDVAESEPDLAATINTKAPAVLAEEAASIGACMVHFSTDYVFSGLGSKPYTEQEEAQPLSIYGKTKLHGELAVAQLCPRCLVFRTSWVFGSHGNNFLKTILRLAHEQSNLRVVNDQVGSPTSAELIASRVVHVLSTMRGVSAGDARWGVYHLTAGGKTTWYGYAKYAIEQAIAEGIKLKVSTNGVTAVSSADYPQTAVRPKNSVLDTAKIRSTFNIELPDWKEGVNQVLHELLECRP